eukprot:747539-Hanusia_phi.AAC.6
MVLRADDLKGRHERSNPVVLWEEVVKVAARIVRLEVPEPPAEELHAQEGENVHEHDPDDAKRPH